MPDTPLSCYFNQSVTPATYRDPSTITCEAPPSPAGTVQVKVTDNGEQFSSGFITFQYVGMNPVPLNPLSNS